MKENLLVTLADKNYIDQAKQLFSSVYWNAGWKGDYMLLAHEIPEKDLKWFRDKGILIKKCKLLYNKVWEWFSPIILDKFYLFTPEFKKWKHVIFLDADIIVRASLDKLMKTTGFNAVTDMDGPKLKNQITEKSKSIFLEKKFRLNKKCFNSGVMAFSTDIIKEDSFSKLKGLFLEYKQFSKFWEQLILNVYFYKKWKKLPLVYNLYSFSLVEYNKINIKRVRAIIFHFVKFDSLYSKPWEKNNPFNPEWKYNLERADLIDLNNIPEGKGFNFYFLPLFLKSVSYIHFLFKKERVYKRIKNIFRYVINTPDRIIGQIGILIKKHNPDLYYKLKGVKK